MQSYRIILVIFLLSFLDAMSKDDMQESSCVKVILTVGTYEGSIHSWEVYFEHAKRTLDIQKYFSAAHHSSLVRCVASSLYDSSVIVSTGADEKIQVYNGKKKIAIGETMVDGDVTSIHLCDNAGKCVSSPHPYDIFMKNGMDTTRPLPPTFAVATTAKGGIHVWKIKADWQPLVVVDAHAKPCTDIALHPTGLLALSVGEDRMLSVIDMSRGAVALSIKHASRMSKCRFSAGEASNYALVDTKDQSVHIVETATNKTLSNIVTESSTGSRTRQNRIVNLHFITESALLMGFEDGTCHIYDTKGMEKVVACSLFEECPEDEQIEQNSSKVMCKDIAVVPIFVVESEIRLIVAAISTCGRASFTGVTKKQNVFSFTYLGSVPRSRFRYTCVTASLCNVHNA